MTIAGRQRYGLTGCPLVIDDRGENALWIGKAKVVMLALFGRLDVYHVSLTMCIIPVLIIVFTMTKTLVTWSSIGVSPAWSVTAESTFLSRTNIGNRPRLEPSCKHEVRVVMGEGWHDYPTSTTIMSSLNNIVEHSGSRDAV